MPDGDCDHAFESFKHAVLALPISLGLSRKVNKSPVSRAVSRDDSSHQLNISRTNN